MDSSKLKGRSRAVLKAFSTLGIVPTVFYAYQRLRHRSFAAGEPFAVHSRAARYPLYCRANTSDVDVFGQIFVHREYRCLDDVRDPGLIVDCGANVGFASAYFLSRFPQARVIAIEPDAGNFAALQRNLRSYGDRARTIHSGVWSHKAGLVISDQVFGDGREWAQTVREARAGETPSMTAIDIGSLLDESGYDRISILKVDIEGSEAVVFAANYQQWIGKVDNLVIELHGEDCESVFSQAIAPQGYSVSRCDELTVCKRAVDGAAKH